MFVLINCNIALGQTYIQDKHNGAWAESYPDWTMDDLKFYNMPLVDPKARDNKPEDVINHHLTYGDVNEIKILNPASRHIDMLIKETERAGKAWVLIPDGYVLHGHTISWLWHGQDGGDIIIHYDNEVFVQKDCY